MMKVGIQGERGSACDEAAALLVDQSISEFEYLVDAKHVLDALASGEVSSAVLAMESPLGVPVEETSLALLEGPKVNELKELKREVRHCIMIHPGSDGEVKKVASHPIPLKKHQAYLSNRFPNYEAIPLDDIGLAAAQLSEGILPKDTAVIAMPRAAEVFGLKIIETELPANDNYLTRFALVENAKE